MQHKSDESEVLTRTRGTGGLVPIKTPHGSLKLSFLPRQNQENSVNQHQTANSYQVEVNSRYRNVYNFHIQPKINCISCEIQRVLSSQRASGDGLLARLNASDSPPGA